MLTRFEEEHKRPEYDSDDESKYEQPSATPNALLGLSLPLHEIILGPLLAYLFKILMAR